MEGERQRVVVVEAEVGRSVWGRGEAGGVVGPRGGGNGQRVEAEVEGERQRGGGSVWGRVEAGVAVYGPRGQRSGAERMRGR